MPLIRIIIFFFFLSLHYSFQACGQDPYESLKLQYDSDCAVGNTIEALPIAKAMNQWALENEGNTSLRYAVSFKYIGNCFQDYDSALKYFQLSKRTLEEQDRKKEIDYALILNFIGITYGKAGNYKKAETYCKEALEIEKNILGPEHNYYAANLMLLGIFYSEMGEYKLAEKYYKQSLDVYEKVLLEERTYYAMCLSNLGILYSRMGDYKSAEIYLMKALEIRKKTLGEEHPDYASSLNSLGALYSDMGDYISAERYLKRAIEIRKSSYGEDHPDYAISLGNLGNLYSHMGDYKTAEACNNQALEITKKALGQEHPYYATCLINLGALYSDMGNYKSAEQYLKQSLEINMKVLGKEHPNYAASLRSLGILYSRMGDYSSAEPYFKQASEIRKKVFGEEHPDYAMCLNDLGVLYSDLGDYMSAEKYYKQSLGIYKKDISKLHPNYAYTLNNLGKLYADMDNFKSAELYYKRAFNVIKKTLEVENPNYAASLNNLGVLYLDIGNYKSAEPYCKQAMEIRKRALGEEHPDYANSLNNLGVLYSGMGDYTSSVKYFKAAFKCKLHQLDINFSWLSTKEKAAYWANESNFYLRLSEFASQAYSEFPFVTILSYDANIISKSLLLETARELDRALSRSTNDTLKNQFNELKQLHRIYVKMQLDGAANRGIMERYRKQADSLDKILVNTLGEYAVSKRKFELCWLDAQQRLNDNEAAIEFSRYYDYDDSCYRYMAQVVRSGFEYPKIVFLCAEKDLPSSNFSESLSNIYELVWQPLDTLLSGVTTVYYSPDGRLYSVPFNALCSNDSTGCTYLMDQYTLHRLSSTRYLADSSLIKTKDLNGTIALFGGIQYDVVPDSIGNRKEESNDDFLLAVNLKRETTRGTMAYLPGTKAEVEGIAKMCHDQKWTTTVSTGAQASETSFKSVSNSSSPSIIHIATHGFAFPDKGQQRTDRLRTMMLQNEGQLQYKVAEDPMLRCGLLFAGANISWSGRQQEMLDKTGDDGILTAAEVAALDLSNTKLVVLSACETGLGKIEGSEGVFGLQRGFKLAGVEQLIVSLWSVPDKETAQMMESFYSDLAITQDPVQSFAKAQKEMRNRFPDNPEKWAGFVLVR